MYELQILGLGRRVFSLHAVIESVNLLFRVGLIISKQVNYNGCTDTNFEPHYRHNGSSNKFFVAANLKLDGCW